MARQGILLKVYLHMLDELGESFEIPKGGPFSTLREWAADFSKRHGFNEETVISYRAKWAKGTSIPAGYKGQTLAEQEALEKGEPLETFDGKGWEVKKIYEVVDGYYVFRPLNAPPFRVTVEDADDAFFRYSEHGLNMTSEEVRIHLNLSVGQWTSFKHNLSLYKRSNVFAPWTWENTPVKEREALVERKMAERMEREGVVVNYQFEKARYKQYKQVIQAGLGQQQMYMALVDMICEAQTSRVSIKLPKAPVRKLAPDHIVVVITDLHNGARVDKMPTGQRFDGGVLRSYLYSAAQQINAYSASKVTLKILGDLMENFMGLMHPNSWQGMEYAAFGSKLFWDTVDLLTWFVGMINNLVEIQGVPGNHDRADGDKKVDPIGQVGLMVFEYLKRQLPIPVVYDEYMISSQINGVNFIGVHYHHQLFKGKSFKIFDHIIKFGKTDMYNLVIGGHIHSLETKIDSRLFRVQIVPSLYTGNDYSIRNGYFSQPQFCVFIPRDGYPEMHVKSAEP